MSNVGTIEYDVKLETAQLKKDVATVEKEVKKSGDSIATHHEAGAQKAGEALSKFAKVATVALAAVSTAVVAFGVSSLKSFGAAQDAVIGLEAGLKNTGEAVADVSSALQKQATALQKVTKFSDEEIVSADAMLTTFQLSGKTIEGLTPSLLDMAEGMRDVNGNTMSLTDAAKMMGKVMGSAEGGVDGLASALSRNGVILSEAQKAIFSTGTETERLNTLTEVLSFNFGGRALAAGQSYTGQMTILANQFDDVKESIGEAIWQGLEPFAQQTLAFVQSDQFKAWLATVIEWIKVNLPIALNYVTNTLLPAFKKIFDDIAPAIGAVLKVFGDLILFISNNTWVVEALAIAFVAVKTSMLLTGALSAFQGVMAGVTTAHLGMAAIVSSPIMLTVLVAAALLAIGSVIAKANEARTAMNNASIAIDNQKAVNDQIYSAYLSAKNNGDTTQAQKYYDIWEKGSSSVTQGYNDLSKAGNPFTGFTTGLNSILGISSSSGGGWARGGYTGNGDPNDIAGLVHKGEYVLPYNMVNQATGLPDGNMQSGASIENNIGTITISNEIDGERWLKRLTQNQEITNKGLTPAGAF